MKNHNRLVPNPAAVAKALQEHLNKRLGIYAPKVVGIEYKDSDKSFTIDTNLETLLKKDHEQT